MKLVTDGEKWAIKKGWLRPKYLDFTRPHLWWFNDDEWFVRCWTNKENAEKWFKRLTA